MSSLNISDLAFLEEIDNQDAKASGASGFTATTYSLPSAHSTIDYYLNYYRNYYFGKYGRAGDYNYSSDYLSESISSIGHDFDFSGDISYDSSFSYAHSS